MRLVERQNDGPFRLTADLAENDLPPYAILSHTWGQDNEEVTFEDMVKGSGRGKAGYDKIKFCGEQAAKDGLQHFWVDTCCIKKSSDRELSEAINSMFRWYRCAAKCYVYLSDVSTRKRKKRDQTSQNTWEPAFRKSRWFTRGWTLQELLAPASVEFFSEEHKRLGDKQSLKQQIHHITEIPISALQGRPLPEFTVEERMSWAAKRETKREEDKSYCLLGIFDTFMPLIYGEGMDHARRRLLKAIDEVPKRGLDLAPKHVTTGSKIPEVNHSLTPSMDKDLLESLRFDEIDDRYMNIKPGLSKTCRWLLSSTEYLDWISADKLSQHHGFFWIKGKPGCGKSTLTKFALLEIRESSRGSTLLSFFFNARGAGLEKSTIGLYRSLLVQLLEKVPDNHQVWNVASLIHRPVDDQLKMNREMLKQMLAQALLMIGQHTITIVIDALDECDEDEVRDMISFFEKLGEDAISEGMAFRVLFSSRHYPHITIRRSVEMKLEDQQGHSHDIDKYLSSELKAGKGKQAEQIRQEIRNKSSGVFMWIVLVVQILNKAFDHGKIHTLQKKLREIPTDLSELFQTILTRDSENLDEVKLCLQCILFANRPLNREELYYAILSGIEPDTLSPWDPETVSTESMDLFILSSSKGLAEITGSEHHTVQFIHESVRDFLLKQNGLGQVWADAKPDSIGLSQDRLKECCSNYIRQSYLSIDGSLRSASPLEEAVLRENASLRFPFLEYAVSNIFAHADVAHAEGVGQKDFVTDFELKDWILLYNITTGSEVYHLPLDLGFLYICADKNLPNLINILMQDGLCKRRQDGRYRHPVFAAINAQGGYYGSALQAASVHGNEEIVDVLISKGADMNVQGGYYGNALQAALAHGNKKIIDVLISKGADINAQGGFYGNALQAALAKGYEKIVDVLISKGADINVQGGYFGNALQAASFYGYKEIVDVLVSKGADINVQGGFYGNALQAASVHGSMKIVDVLINKGADINVQGGYFGNTLQAASVRGNKEIVDVLISKGADINAQGGFYGNALQAASVHGNEKIVDVLISKGADINAQGGHHGNALQGASTRGNDEIVKILVGHGTVIDKKGCHTDTGI